MPSIMDATTAFSALGLVVIGLIYIESSRDRAQTPTPGAERGESNKLGPGDKLERAPGEWRPVSFSYPHIESCPDDLEHVDPIPYRPFRWGAYNVTMGIRSMPWNAWLQIDNDFVRYHHIHALRVRERGTGTVRTLPGTPGLVAGGADAAKELVQEVAEYLSRRYPAVFSVTRANRSYFDISRANYGWYGQERIKTITIIPVGVTYDTDSQDPLWIVAHLIQDDLAIMIEGTDGQYYFQAGAVCVSGFWRMEDKIGMPLDEIHTSGDVPQYAEKLQPSLGRFFRRLSVDKAVTRNNYFIQICRDHTKPSRPRGPYTDLSLDELDPDEVAWSATTNGPEELYPAGVPRTERDVAVPAVAPSMLRLRTERQTLRRLPRTGAIVFTFRTYLFRVDDLAQEPGVPGRFASAVRSWGEDVAQYKKQTLYKDVLLPYLDECHARQVQEGQVDEADRSSKYPF